jgi:xylulokinase
MPGSIGIDVGSTNVKAVALDEAFRCRAACAVPLTWNRSGPVAEQDAHALWDAVVVALRSLAEATASSGGLGDVSSIGVCGQYSSIVPVGPDLKPLAPMRLYLDTRGSAHCHELLGRPGLFELWLERHPIPTVGGGLALGHLLSFQLDRPDLHQATTAYLEPVDYVTTRLTGEIAATQGSMFAGQLVDNRTLGATAYDPELVAASGVDPSRLPGLVAPSASVGTVRAALAAEVGLGPGVEVRAGMTDSQAAALACGAGTPGRVGVAIGTTAVVLATTGALAVDLDHEVLTMPGVYPDRYLVWAENGLAGRAVETVLTHLVHADDPLGAHGDGDPFTGFDAALAESAPGAGGVLFLPWMSGSLAPQADPTVRGGFVGLSLDSRRVDLVRAAAEGVAHNLRWLLEPVEAFLGHQPGTAFDHVVLIGGAARSPGWTQVLADVLDRPIRTVEDPGTAGARAVAAWSTDPGSVAAPSAGDGRGPSPSSAWAASFEPDPATTAVHAATQARFTAAFDALRPLRLGVPAV